MRREAWADDLFQETRGPLSTSLQSWLEANIDDYDLVLGHSIPFSTSVLAHGYAKRHGKPFVILPHFHVEDEFYHWRSYYEALAGADEVITGPKAAEPLFFDKLGCKSGYLPFGINLDEAPAEEDEQRFGALYASELPYVLILGRKAGAKNYAQVIEAVKRVNADGRRCNVVFIGRDEDGAQLRPEEVLFLGPRPRGIVLAALKRALCLVSMSESESFGIVILESWAQRRPVIVNDQCTASIELVEDGANGLLADKNSLDAQIRRLLDDKVAADAMGAAGYDEVERRFTWRAISAALNERLLKIVERA
jgi:glycosyltransferase involved in cell wall biosynthesis